jgi:hypothetical protein
VRIEEVLVPVVRMRRAEALGDEGLHLLADELRGGVAEELLGDRVDDHDPAEPVGDHHRVGRRVEHSLQARRDAASVLLHRHLGRSSPSFL